MSENKCGLDDWFASGRSSLELDLYIVDALPGSVMDWEPPLPLDDPTGIPFPVDALTSILQDMTIAVAEETQTAPGMAASVAIGTISAAAGGKYEVAVPEHGWHEPVHIQGVTVAEPAQRKTQIFRIFTQPIVNYERDVNLDERKALAQWESRARVLEKQLASAEQARTKAADPAKLSNAEAVRMAAVNELEAHRDERPRITQIITDDATPEAVKSLLAEQGGAIAAMSAESAFLSNTAGGRYSDAPNLDVLLNGHAGDRIRVDRKGRSSETIERACLTLCLMVQPDVIRDLGKSQGFIARGGAARLLPSFPPDMLGHRRIDVTPVPLELTEAWSATITRILTRKPVIQDGTYIPWQLVLSKDAHATFREYREWHEPQMSRDGALGDIRDWAGKQAGTVLRIAGILHVAEHDVPEAVPITGATIEQAIVITDYFEQHARIMYRLMRGRSGHADARTVLKAIRELGSSTTRRDVHRKLHNRAAFASSDDLSAPLALLEEFGYIKRARSTTDQGGRPSERILLNPSEVDDKTDTTPQEAITDTGSVGSVIGFPEKETDSDDRQTPLDPTGTDDDWSMDL